VTKKSNVCPEYRMLYLGQIQENITLHIFKYEGGCVISWVCLSSARPGKFFMIERNGIELSTGKILEENLVQSAFHQTLKHKAKYTLESLTKMMMNVPERHIYNTN
jgi:hypothetical protein